jgi:PAS domain S-box-containing protein
MTNARHDERVDPAFLAGDGEISALMRTHDWSASPLGHPSAWPQSLRSVVSLLLNSRFPMFVAWGPQLGFLYNDPYKEILGSKHPAALGARFQEIWSEIWPDIEPLIDAALAGEATYREDLPLLMRRKGFDEQTWFTFSYSPVRDESGQVAGMFCACTETTGKMLAERHLAGESERLQQMFQQAPGFMAMLRSPEHVFELANAAYMRLVGQRDVIGRPVRQAFPDLEGQGFFQALDRVYATGEAVVFNAMPVKLASQADGIIEERFLDLIYQPITGPDGQVSGVFAEGSDVTERVKAEQALRESEAFTRRILESSGDCIMVLSLDGTLEFMSPGGLCTMEIDDFDTFKGRYWPDLWSGREHVKARAAVAQARVGGIGRFQGYSPTAKGGMRYWDVVLTPILGVGGQPQNLLSISRDISEQRQAEEALQGLNATLELQVEERTRERNRTWQLSQDLLVINDHAGTINAVNQRWTELLGWKSHELIGRSFVEITHPDDVEPTLSAFRDIFERPLTEPYEYRLRHKDGHYRWFAWTGAYDDGRIYASGRDTTAEREQATALAQAEEALRQAQKMEAVGQLTGGIAHDFNNMLAVIVGSLDLLKRRIGVEDARARRYLHAAADGARRATLLTQRLLAFSRQQPLRPEPIDVNKLVAGLSDLLRHSLGADIHLETVLAGGLWRTHADPNQLENVILNLAVNARDAMPGGGRLTIEAQNVYLDTHYVASEIGVAPGQYVMIAATDTGSGMSPEVVAKAFDPFYTTKAIGKGTGLGLSQVYGFVRQSNGHVKIYSEVGHGTTVKIYLPRLFGPADEVVEETAVTDMPFGEQQESVLVVEDEPAVRQFSVDALGELGYRVLEADGAATALRLLDAHPEIALLFTDVVMPDVNGARLADEARRRRPDLRVLFTTGYTRNAVVHNGVLDAGVQLLGKPFTVDELAIKVRDVLDTPLDASATVGDI